MRILSMRSDIGGEGPFYVQQKDGHFDLADIEEFVDASIDEEASESDYIEFILGFFCAQCGKALDFGDTEDEDSEEMYALFPCHCKRSNEL